ncbi:MAG TPA: SCO family protein [Gemmatimonadales bacterium]|nr:SCO family protein [Gemmatimonadales bacterium]
MRSSPVLLVLLISLTSCRPEHRSWTHSGLSGPEIRPPLPKPDLILTGTDGHRFDLRRETEGFVTLLFFGYTRCPDLCPVQMANIAQAMKRIDPALAARIRVVFVTVDPRRDTPPVLRAWLDHFDSRFIGLTGDSASIAYALTQLRLQHPEPPRAVDSSSNSSYTINHTVLVLAFTRDDLAHLAYPTGIRVDEWARDLALLAKED